jgi:hypothetical protein
MRRMGRLDNFGFHRVERLDGNVGYLDVACDEDRSRILSQSIRSGRRPVAGGRLVVR